MRVALAHDYLNQYGGAERVLEVLHEMYPQAPVFTIVVNLKNMPERFKDWEIVPSFCQRLPFLGKHYEKYFFLFPVAVEGFDLRGFDVVLSVSSAWVKGVITPPETCHISYCLSPMRFGWFWYHARLDREKNRLYRSGLQYFLNRIRVWDAVNTHRVDRLVAISDLVRKRIWKYYRRDSEVIHPPVDCDFFKPGGEAEVGDYYLMVSRLKPYKALDIAIRAFSELGLPLLIVGEGSARSYLQSIARSNVQFLGHISDEEVLSYYRRCAALVFPGVEDFGITPLEANACGKPVIAFRGGGTTETIIEGETGVFFYPQTSGTLMETVKSFDPSRFDSRRMRENALRFDKSVFKRRLGDLVRTSYEEHWSEGH